MDESFEVLRHILITTQIGYSQPWINKVRSILIVVSLVRIVLKHLQHLVEITIRNDRDCGLVASILHLGSNPGYQALIKIHMIPCKGAAIHHGHTSPVTTHH